MKCIFWVSIGASSLFTGLPVVYSQDFVGDPFALIESTPIEIASKPSDERAIRFSGEVTSIFGYSPQAKEADWSELKLRALLKLDLDLTPSILGHISTDSFYDYAYEHRGIANFDNQTQDEYVSQLELFEGYVSTDLDGGARLKVGRQVIAWGNSELDRVFDFVTPLDQRKIGMQDIGEQRLGVTSARYSTLWEKWQLDVVVLPEVRPDRVPTRDSGLDPYGALRDSGAVIESEAVPGWGLDNLEFAMRVKKLFHGGDFTWVLGHVFDDTAHLNFQSFNGTNIFLRPEHRKLFIYGLGATYADGAWLLKFEAVNQHRKAVARTDLMNQIIASGTAESWESKTVSRYMLGFDYTGISDLFVSIEYIGNYVHDYEAHLFGEEVSHAIGTVLRHDSFNEKLFSRLTAIYFADDGGGLFVRLNLDYELTDNVEIGCAYTLFDSNHAENAVFPFRNGDRLNLSLNYTF